MVDPLWQLAIKLFFSVLFLSTAWHKWQDIHHTATVVAKYRLLPVGFAYRAAYVVAGLEALIVVLLWLYQPLGAVLLVFLLLAYTAAIGINLQRGRTSMDCGCGGVPIRLSPALLGRNAILLVMALLLVFSSTARSYVWADGLMAVFAALSILVMYYAAEQLLANRGQGVVRSKGA